jgi:hypothetical protein
MSLRYWFNPKEVYVDVRYMVRYRIPGYFRRAWYGWAPQDTWSFDHYLASVIAEGLEHMADHAHGWPFFIQEELGCVADEYGSIGKDNDDACLHAWKVWLYDKARWFRWYAADHIGLRPGMTDAEKSHTLDFWEKQEKHFYEVVLPDFCKRFGNLWD